MKYLKNPWLLAAAGCFLIGLACFAGYLLHTPAKELTPPEFERLLASDALGKTTLEPTPFAGFYRIEGTRKASGKTQMAALSRDAATEKGEKFYITTHLEEAQLRLLLEKHDAKIDMPGAGARGQWINIVSTLMIAGLVTMLVVYQLNIGKGKNAQVRERPTVAFRDVAGIEEAKGEVQEIVDFLRDPKKYQRLGGALPKGVLLIGPPGTGKTMLAKAIACEAKASFFSVHGSDFTEVFVGVGAKRVRQLFRQAAKNKPAIIFIDEIDCVGKNRKFDTHGEHQQTINALLAAMDGFESRGGNESAGRPGRGAAAAGTVRPEGVRAVSGHERAAGDFGHTRRGQTDH